MDNLLNSFPIIARFLHQRVTEDELMETEEVLTDRILYELILSLSNGDVEKIKKYYEKVIPRQAPSTFKTHFRISITSFEVVFDVIGNSPAFNKKDQEQFGGREQRCPEKALLVTLWVLATPDSYRSVGERFVIAKSSVYNCLKIVIDVILYELAPKFIRWPMEEEKDTIAESFAKNGLPNIIGAIDGCHILIKRPSENGVDYFNRKQFYSMVLQGICKPDLSFIDCDIRWPGSVHDGRVLRTSDMYPIAQELCGPTHFLIGDSAYPLKNWLIVPFRNNGHLLPQQVYFNKILSKTRVVIENSFALLKGRFRRLKDCLDRDNPSEICRTVIAACVLHNICLINGENEIEQLIQEGRELEPIQMVGEHNQNDVAGVERRNQLVADLGNRITNKVLRIIYQSHISVTIIYYYIS